MTHRGEPGGVIRAAVARFEELTGNRPESVSSMHRGEDGDWTFRVEVVELRRIPDAVSLLATYELYVDSDGDLSGWERVRRYERGGAGR
mgnify:CR=1 FL=1